MTTATTVHQDSHPCFGSEGRTKLSRVHLPVACLRNARLRYGMRESKGNILLPKQALEYLENAMAESASNSTASTASVGMVAICGQGEPFANIEATMTTLYMVREAYPDMALCLTTNGMHLAPHAKALAEIGLSHITIEMHAVDPDIAEKLYAWVRPAKKTVPLAEGVAYLIKKQVEAIIACKSAGLTVKINTTLFGDINADHVEAIACTVAGLGADIMSVAPCPASEEGLNGAIPENEDGDMVPSAEALQVAREAAARHMPLMTPWNECGCEPFGTAKISSDQACCADGASGLAKTTAFTPKPTAQRPNVAVASAGGMEVDTHLGHANTFLIYGPRADGVACLLETRPAPASGGGDDRWANVSNLLSDCFSVLVSGVGQRPREVLGQNGIHVLTGDWEISGIVDVLYGGGKKGKKLNKTN